MCSGPRLNFSTVNESGMRLAVLLAGHFVGVGLGLIQKAVVQITEAQSVQPLILHNASEVRMNLVLRGWMPKVPRRSLHRTDHQIGPNLEIPDEPFQRQRIDERDHSVCDQRQHERQREDESQREIHRNKLVYFGRKIKYCRHMYPYGLIGNCQISALISDQGSIDWLLSAEAG